MPKPPLPRHLVELLGAANPAVLATVRPDGQPVTVATWYLIEDDGRILVNMDKGRRRLDYLRQDPRVSLTVLSHESWGTHVTVQGRIDELVPDRDLADIDRVAMHYTGKPYPVRHRGRVSGWIDIGSGMPGESEGETGADESAPSMDLRRPGEPGNLCGTSPGVSVGPGSPAAHSCSNGSERSC